MSVAKVLLTAEEKNKRKIERKEKKEKEKRKIQEEETISADVLLPPGATAMKNVIDGFDYNSLADEDDLELYIIRAPTEIKAKYLENVEIASPPPSMSSLKVGNISRKQTTYDIWSVRGDSELDAIVGGDEVLGLSCLVPRKKDGKLVLAPKLVARHLVIAAQPVQPTAPPSEVADKLYESPVRYQHPKHLLKHRFLPTGTLPATPEDVDIDMARRTPPPSQSMDVRPAKQSPEASPTKKKRKAEEEEAKRMKKAKAKS